MKSAEAFRAEIRRIAADGEVLERNVTVFGGMYTVPGELRGPLGTTRVLTVWIQGRFEVEFVHASGGTEALVTLEPTDLRPLAEGDVLAVRQP